MDKEEIIYQLDLWIIECQQEAVDFFERDMTASEMSALGAMSAYIKVKLLLLEN